MAADRAAQIQGFSDLKEIGSGGFAKVYAATEDFFDRRVAVKVLTQELDASDRRRFERECRTMARLSDHPNVVTLYSAGYTDDDRPFIVMELVNGGSLADRLESGSLPWPQVQNIGVKMAEALSLAHELGVLHRDIKPANILMVGDEPKLTDFGIASFVDSVGTLTDYAVSWRYASPETFGGTRDERSDIYSLGSTLYALLNGMAPFVRTGESSINPLLNRILNEEPQRIARRDVPQDLQDLILEMLRKKPSDRPQTAASLSDRLKKIEQSQTATVDTVDVPKFSLGSDDDVLLGDSENRPANTNSLGTKALLSTDPKPDPSTVIRGPISAAAAIGQVNSNSMPSAAPDDRSIGSSKRWRVAFGSVALLIGVAVFGLVGFLTQNWVEDRSSDAEPVAIVGATPDFDVVFESSTTEDRASSGSAEPTVDSAVSTTIEADNDQAPTSETDDEPAQPLPPSTDLATKATERTTTTKPTTTRQTTTTRRTTTARSVTTQRVTTTTRRTTTRPTTTRRTTTSRPTTTRRTTTTRPTTTRRTTTTRPTTTTTTSTTMPERVTVGWDASPSGCDANNKRSFSANVNNATSGTLRLTMRILDSANNFVHGSHIYTATASNQVQVLLAGIPPGQSTVQIVNMDDDEVVSQRIVIFGTC